HGAPVTGFTGKVSVDAGQASVLFEEGNGLYSFVWTPPLLEAAAELSLKVRGHSPSQEAIKGEWTVPLQPVAVRSMSVDITPNRLLIGADLEAELEVDISSQSGGDHGGAALRFSAMAGKVTNITHQGSGTYTARYLPDPAVRYPHVDVITVTDLRDPDTLVGQVTVSLVGQTNFPVVGIPDSEVVIRIGERQYGPVTADSTGRVRVPVQVPPGEVAATLVATLGEKSAEEPLDLMVPASPRVNLAPTPGTLPADGKTSIDVVAAVSTPEGEPDTDAQVSFSATVGTVGDTRNVGEGLYATSFTPPYGHANTQATLQVSVADERTVQSDSATIALLAARPASISMVPEPANVAPDAEAFKV
ncbi:MAG: hypothetical protein QGG40_22250, partial [Myxococcota bacterium]|nr:hypothetical protein [Myxococcota bacterium]